MKSFYLISLGCAKNLVDSEVMIGSLQHAGWRCAEEPETADALIVNTCGFIQPAVEEAIDEIFELIQIKQEGRGQKVIVVGCFVQRYKSSLVKELPEVDLFIGTEAPERLPKLFAQLFGDADDIDTPVILPSPFLMSSNSPRQLTTTGMAWLKITEGCDNRCTYCMIPSIRGSLRSRACTDIVREAEQLERQGVQELCIIAQDTTAYGDDLGDDEHLQALLEKLLAQTTIPWLRLLYLYPNGITQKISDGLLGLLAEEERLLPYLDIPFQHVSDSVLRRMNRHHRGADIERLVDSIRSAIPHIALRTTFLVGFPGESENDFLQIEAFLQKYRLDHVGVFPYCNEQGVPSEHFSGQIEEEERIRRQQHLLNVQRPISAEIQQKYIGQLEPVLVQGVSAETDLLLEGRTRYQAPDVDGIVYINEGTADAGEIVMVRIEEAHDYDLVGGIVQ